MTLSWGTYEDELLPLLPGSIDSVLPEDDYYVAPRCNRSKWMDSNASPLRALYWTLDEPVLEHAPSTPELSDPSGLRLDDAISECRRVLDSLLRGSVSSIHSDVDEYGRVGILANLASRLALEIEQRYVPHPATSSGRHALIDWESLNQRQYAEGIRATHGEDGEPLHFFTADLVPMEAFDDGDVELLND